MEVARLWGRDPDWMSHLDAAQRALLLAWYRVHLDPEGPEARKLRKAKEKVEKTPTTTSGRPLSPGAAAIMAKRARRK